MGLVLAVLSRAKRFRCWLRYSQTMGQLLGRFWEQIQGSGQLIGRLWEWLQGSAFASRRTYISNEDRLFSLMIREHYFVEKTFNNKRREYFLRWQTCPETVIQALQDIYDDDILNNYEERLRKTKATVEITEGFPDKELPYKQEMLTYIYSCAGLTYIKMGDFTQAKGFDQKDWEMAVDKLLGKLPVDEHPWEVALLHFAIIRCHLQAEDTTVSLECSSRSLDAARKSEDRKLLLYGTVLHAYAEAKRHSNLWAFKYVSQSLEISESLNYEVATTILNDVYWELHKKVVLLPTIATGEPRCLPKGTEMQIVAESAAFNPREDYIFRRVSSSSDEHDYPDQVTEDITESMVAQRFDLRLQSTLQFTEDIIASPVNQGEPRCLPKGTAMHIVAESAVFNPREDYMFRRVSSSSDEHDYPDQVTEDITESMVAQRFDLRFQSTLQSTEDITASPVNQDEPHGLTNQSLAFVHLEQATHRKDFYTDHRANGDDTEPKEFSDHRANGDDTEPKEFSGSTNPIEETKPKELSGCYTPGRLGPEGKSNRSSFNPTAPSYSRTSTDSDTSEEETVPKEI